MSKKPRDLDKSMRMRDPKLFTFHANAAHSKMLYTTPISLTQKFGSAMVEDYRL
jgi:hypothetical protein